MGATQIALSLVTAPEVTAHPELTGRSIALDAVSTGFAFVLYGMLVRRGLAAGDGALAAILRDGMATVLALRSRYGAPKRALTDIDKYLDLTFYEEVMRNEEEGS